MSGKMFVGRAAGQGWVYAQLWWGPMVLGCVYVGGKDRRGMGSVYRKPISPTHSDLLLSIFVKKTFSVCVCARASLSSLALTGPQCFTCDFWMEMKSRQAEAGQAPPDAGREVTSSRRWTFLCLCPAHLLALLHK